MAGKHRPRLQLSEIEQICRRHSLPLTVQRRVILEILSSRTDHPTADQMFDVTSKRIPEVSRTTVYRVLETLVRLGVARKVCHPGAAARYELETHRHHHLVCLNCETVVDLEDPALDGLSLPDARSGFRIEDYSIQFRGLCAACAAKQSGHRTKKTNPVALRAKSRRN